MKKLIKKYREWRYLRLYRKLFWHYANNPETCQNAGELAADAFQWFTAIEYNKFICSTHK